MRRRRLKYATANNGAEAVEKWRTGQYHLILVPSYFTVSMKYALSSMLTDGHSNASHGWY